MIDLAYILAGAVVGLAVGMTGVGGGSLMTPILVYGFGIQPTVAVGTDLLFAGLTKSGGSITHARRGNVDWRVAGWLALGSFPATLATIGILHAGWIESALLAQVMKRLLGFALVATAIAVLARPMLRALAQRLRTGGATLDVEAAQSIQASPHAIGLVLFGLLIGVMVTLTSVGAGAIGVAVLMWLAPHLTPQRIVGTDIAHAVPLTLAAGLGYAGLGNVNWTLLALLLCGSLPGIWLGTRLVTKFSPVFLRNTLCVILAGIGTKLLIA